MYVHGSWYLHTYLPIYLLAGSVEFLNVQAFKFALGVEFKWGDVFEKKKKLIANFQVLGMT
jgi:hypothetical protein